MAQNTPQTSQTEVPLPWLGKLLGRTRFIVIVAVLAVMAVSISLFLLGSLQAFYSLKTAWAETLNGQTDSTKLTIEFLKIVSVMLKAVVFYLIGVGLYSLFVAPLNITLALGVESLIDLENKVLSVVIVIMSTTFLEHFIQWKEPLETLQFAASLGLVVLALVGFQLFNHRAREDHQTHNPDMQARAQHDMVHTENEHHEISPEEVEGKTTQSDGKPQIRGD